MEYTPKPPPPRITDSSNIVVDDEILKRITTRTSKSSSIIELTGIKDDSSDDSFDISNNEIHDQLEIDNDFWEAHSESSGEEEEFDNHNTNKNKLTFEVLKKQLSSHYKQSTIHKYSSALDILASYIRSQAFIYNEAGSLCRYHLNCLMLPCIFLSSMCSVFSTINKKIPYGIIWLSSLNAFISFLLAIVNYLKLDASAEAHQIASNHYYRLRSLLEFTSAEVLLFEHPLLQKDGVDKKINEWCIVNKPIKSNVKEINDYTKNKQLKLKELYDIRDELHLSLIGTLQEKITNIKKKILEIRENNRFTIPKKIMNTYPIIYNINIFSFIKTVDDYHMLLVSKLKNTRNEIRYLSSKVMDEDEKIRIKDLYNEKNRITSEYFVTCSSSNLIDIMFQQEIKNNVLYKKYCVLFYIHNALSCICGKNIKCILPREYKNPYECGYKTEGESRHLIQKILNV
jgi:hypothetical protein